MGRLPATGVNDLKSQYPEIAAQWHPTMNGSSLPEQVAVHSNKAFYWLCDKGHTYQKSPDKRVRGEDGTGEGGLD